MIAFLSLPQTVRHEKTLQYKLEMLSREAANKDVIVFKTCDVRVAAQHPVTKVAVAWLLYKNQNNPCVTYHRDK